MKRNTPIALNNVMDSVLNAEDIHKLRSERQVVEDVGRVGKSEEKIRLDSPVWYLLKIIFVYVLLLVDMFLNSSVNSDNYNNIAQNDFWPFLFLV